ncbi:MAG: CoA-binding protein [Phyllobacterium sp.]
MNHDHYSIEYISDILHSVRTIAMVGASPKEARPVFGVMKFLLARGYHVIPVNPGQAGKEILGQMTYARLADIPAPIDMVDVFRASDAIAGVVDETLALDPLPKVIWMQLGIRNDEAARRAEARDVRVVMNRCPAIEWQRLLS